MRCTHFVPVAKRTKTVSERPDQPIPNLKSTDSSTLHQPSSNLPPPLLSTSPLSPRQIRPSSSKGPAPSSVSTMRRSQRDSAKIQSCDQPESSDPSTTLGNLHSATTVLPGHNKHPRMMTTSSSSSSSSYSSSTSLKPQHQPGDALSGVGAMVPRSGQSEFSRTGGGRHPHPPSANNSKLKHKCPFDGCPWRFATPYKLRRHIKSHTKETPYLCKECGRGFSVRYNLLMHIQTIHSQPQRFKCPVRGCKDAFHSQSRLNGHLRRIHKNDWKSLQGIKEPAKNGNRRGGSISSTDSSDSIPAVAIPNRRQKLSNTIHKCQKCGEEFSSKAKLTLHNKIHSGQEKEVLKCTVQDCEKVFSTRDKLNRHVESHNKNSKQFCCPHKNCNRIFLRQTHLRNHLKIHTQDHQFICPVLDCSQKFSSEGAYNVHLNTHINYGYSCPHPDCDVTFLSHKRLAVHTQVVHGSKQTGSGATLLDEIRPHLGEQLEHHGDPSLLSASSSAALHLSSSSSSLSKTAPIKCVLDKDFLKHIDLPGLSADDIEAVLSENEDWSGEQIDQFLRSAIDLSEIESKLSSMTSYESDSGYSTYDVSPITSTAPANLNFSRPQMVGPRGLQPPHIHHPCPPPSLGLLDHSSPSPLFSNPPFLSLPLQSQSTASSSGLMATSPTGAPPLIHDPICSPCTSDGGFFSPHSVFNTPNHDPVSFFPSHSPVSLYPSQPFPPPQDFNIPGRNSSSNIFSPSGPCFPDAMHNIGLPMSDLFLHELCQNHIPTFGTPTTAGSMNPPFMECSQSDALFPGAVSVKMENGNPCLGGVPMEMELAPPLPIMKQEEESSVVASHPASVERRVSLECTTMSPTSPLSVSSHISLTAEPARAGFSPEPLVSSSIGCDCKAAPSPPAASGRSSPVVTSSSSSSGESVTSEPQQQRKTKNLARSQGKSVVMKAKKKGQWPRSMNTANLLAFRERILSKLKKGQEIAADPLPQSISHEITTIKNPNSDEDDCKPSSSSMPVSPPLIKCEPSSPSSVFEVHVMQQRNCMSTTKRSLSEPADLHEFFHPLRNEAHHSSSTGNISEDLVFSCSSSSASSPMLAEEKFLGIVSTEDANDLLNDLNFNPDVLLSSNLDERMLDSFGFRFNTPDEDDRGSSEGLSTADAEIASLLSRTETSSFPSTSSPPSSVGDMSTAIDMDCIHSLLMDSGGSEAPTCSPQQSLSGSPTPPASQSDSDSCSSAPAAFNGQSASPTFRKSLDETEKLSIGVTPMTNGTVDSSSNSHSLQFPEIFSIEGSMTLDGVGVASKRQAPGHPSNCMREAFLHSTHDPLLTAERHSVALFDAF